MDEAERQELIDEVDRPSATVGADIPETITVGEDELPLDEFVIETRKVAGIPDEIKPVVREAQVALTEERTHLLGRLRSDPLERAEATELADTIVGIDRALNALESLRGERFAGQSKSATIDDYKRWVGFLDTIRE